MAQITYLAVTQPGTGLRLTHQAVAIDRQAAVCRRDAAQLVVRRAIRAFEANRQVPARRAAVLRAIHDLGAAENALDALGGEP